MVLIVYAGNAGLLFPFVTHSNDAYFSLLIRKLFQKTNIEKLNGVLTKIYEFTTLHKCLMLGSEIKTKHQSYGKQLQDLRIYLMALLILK